SGRLKRPVAKFLRDFVYARASAIFTISRYSKDRLVEIGVPANKVAIYPPGFSGLEAGIEGPSASVAKEQLGLAHKKVILQVSRLLCRKAEDTVIDARPAILGEVPTAVYAVVGDGPDRSKLEARATSRGLQQSVIFAGRVDASTLAKWYAAADIFV